MSEKKHDDAEQISDEQLKDVSGGSDIRTSDSSTTQKQKKWMVANFDVEIGGLNDSSNKGSDDPTS